MSRPTINRPESSDKFQTEDVGNVRSNSLRPVFDYINDESSWFNKLIYSVKVNTHYKPSSKIDPILQNDKKHINSCMSIMSDYLKCREIKPEYKCEEIREFLLRIKCI